MPYFEYHGRTSEGKSIHGKRIAQSSELLATQLIHEGITPVKIFITNEKFNEKNFFRKIFLREYIPLEELAIFCRQMHALLKSGVSASIALRQLAENTHRAYFSSVLNGLIEGIESGRELSDVMMNYPNVFSVIMINMIKIGQNTGNLDDSFLRLNQYLELESAAMKQVKMTLRYPAFVLFGIVCAFFVVVGWVIPIFARMFLQANLPLPIFTQLLIGISNGISHYGWLIFIISSIMIIGIYRWMRTKKGKLQWGKWQLKLPIFGRIMRRIILLRFAQSFSMVIRAGVPLLDGVKLVANTTNNTYAITEIESLRDSIQHGLSLPRAVAATKLFTPFEVQMFAMSEETGDLSAMLDQIAAYYHREVEYDLKRLNDMIEPLIMVILGVFILILALAVYLPIWNMVKLVHHH